MAPHEPRPRIATRAEIYRMRTETLRDLQRCRRIAADPDEPGNVRYLAIVMADEVSELIEDIDEALRMMPEV